MDAQALVEIVGKQSVSGPAGVAAGALASVEAAAGKAGGVLVSVAGAALKAGAALASIGAAGVVAGLSAATSKAADFEKQMSAVGAVSGATAQQMKDLSALALKLGADTSFSASESAQGIGELAKAGVSLADIMGGAAKASLDLAAAGGVSVAEAAEIASNAMNVFGIKGKDMAHVADEIAGAANASAIDVNDFKFSLAAAGSVAATVGIGFDDLTTAIAVMGQAGIKGSDAGTSLKTMLLNLQPSTKSAKEEMQKLGIITKDGANQFFDAHGKAKSMAEIAGVLQNATKGLSEAQRIQALQTLFGTDAIRAAAIMASAGAKGFDEMASSIGHVSAADVANTRLDNLAGSIEKFKGSAETAAITVGQHLTPPLRRLVDIGTDLINRSLPALDRYGALLGQAFDALITRVQHAAPSLERLRDIAQSLAGRAGSGLRAVHEAALDLIDDFGRLVGLELADYARGWDTLRDALSRTWDIAQPFIDGLLDMGRDALPLVQGALSQAVPVIRTAGQFLADYVISNVRFLTTYVLPAFYDVAVMTFSFLRDEAPVLANIAGVLHEQLGKTILWLADTVFPPLVNMARQTVEWFNARLLPIIPPLADALRNGIGGALDWLAQTGWPAMLSAAGDAIDWVQGTGLPSLSSLVGWLGPKLSAALSWLTQTGWPALVSAATSVTDWATNTALPALASLWQWLSPKLASALTWLTSTGWPALVSAAGAVSDWVTGTALPALSSLWQWLSPKLSAALGWLTDTGWPALVSAAGAVSDWITNTAAPALSDLWDWLSPKLQAALGWLTDTGWPAFQQAAGAVWDWITNTALPKLQEWWSWLEEKTRPAVQWFIDTGWPGLQLAGQTVVDMFSAMTDWTGRLWQRLADSKTIDVLSAAFSQLWDAGRILVETFWPGMVGDENSGARGANLALDIVVTLIKGAAGFLRAFAEGVHAIAEGLRAVKQAADGFPDWLREALQRGSFFMGPGGSIVRGIVGSPGQQPPVQVPQMPAAGAPVGQSGSADFGAIDNSSRGSFVRTAWPYMLQAAGGNRDLAEMMLAAAISENGDVGKGGDFIGNNFFGIKGEGPAGHVTVPTWEMINGQRVNITDNFAAYNNPVEGFHGFLDFLQRNPRYASALSQFQQTGDAATLFQGINAAGYATDPAWASKVANIRANQVSPITGGLSSSMMPSAQDMSAATDAARTLVPMLGQVREASTGASVGLADVGSSAAATGHRFQILANAVDVDISQASDGMVTQITDAAGDVTSTVTDMSGKVVRQFAQMADGTLIASDDLGSKLESHFDETGQYIVTKMTDAAGNVVETVTDMTGKVVLQSATMAQTAGANIAAVGTAAANAASPLDALSRTFDDPQTGTTQAALAAAEAARQYADAIGKVEDAASSADDAVSGLFDSHFDFSFGGGRASGGGVRKGVGYLVGERRPELFVPSTDGMILPDLSGIGGKDGGIDEDRLAASIARELVAADVGGTTIVEGDNYVSGVGVSEVAGILDRRQQKQRMLRGGQRWR